MLLQRAGKAGCQPCPQRTAVACTVEQRAQAGVNDGGVGGPYAHAGSRSGPGCGERRGQEGEQGRAGGEQPISLPRRGGCAPA